MEKGYYTIFNNINSDEYTEQEKLHSIKDILSLVTHNSITKQSIICAFRWFYDYCIEEAKTPQTNADRIRNMTDEELAEFWEHGCDEVIDCKVCEEPRNEYGSCTGQCRKEYLRWLQKEVE